LCSGIGKVLKTNGFFGFNGFSSLPNYAIGGLTAGQPASQNWLEGCRSVNGGIGQTRKTIKTKKTIGF
jgi:hypothetical protein